MGQDLFGKQVLNTYDAIIKVGDNDTLTGIAKQLSDGRGNDAPIWLSTARMGIGITPDTNYTLTVNGAAKIGSLDVTGAVTAASVRLTGGSGSQGLMTWNTDEETVDIVQNGATLQVGQEVQVHVKNQTGALIPDGTPVYVTGTLGSSGRLTVAPMIADGTIEAKYFLGITTEDIGDGEDGKVTTFGKIRGLNTSAYSEGTTLYVSASTAGAFQTTAPVAPNLDLEVAIVINSHVNNGTIFVRAQQGHYLGLLHDVYLNTPANNQFLVYNSTTSRWENQGIASVGSINLDTVTDNGNTTTNNINVGDITAGNMTLSGYLRGAANFVIDPAAYGDETGVVQILGDLRVDGTTTTINSTTVTIDDKNLVLASGSATAADANGAGITIDGANATLIYASATDDFTFNKDLNVSGNLRLNNNNQIKFKNSVGTEIGVMTFNASNELILFNGNSPSGDIIFKDGGATGTTNLTIDGATGDVIANNFVGDLTGNADTASAWETARTVTIGDTGKSVDGSADVSWSQAEIGTTFQDVVTNGSVVTTGVTINGVNYGSYGSGSTDITSLIAGSTFGGLIEGVGAGHMVVGIKENGGSDSFSIISGGGNWTSDNTYDTLVAQFNANGAIIFPSGNVNVGSGSLLMNGSTVINNSKDIFAGNITAGGITSSGLIKGQASTNSEYIGLLIQNTFDDDLATSNPIAAIQLTAASNNAYLRCYGAPADTASKHQIDLGSTAGSSFVTLSPSSTEVLRATSTGVSITGDLEVSVDVTAPNFIGDLEGNADTATDADTLDLLHATDFTLDYVTGNGATTANKITLDGGLHIDTATNTKPLEISRSGGTTSQVVKIGVYDTSTDFLYIEDTTSEGNGSFGSYRFILGGNDGETDIVALQIRKDNLILAGSISVGDSISVGGTTVIDSSRNVFANDITANELFATSVDFEDLFLTNASGGSLVFRNSQSNTVDTDNLATVSFQGYYDSAFVGASRIQVKANEDFSATARGTVINFDFWDTGSVYDTVASIDSSGLYIGTTNVYDNLPDGITYSTTDNRLKIGVSKNVGSTTETAIQPILLANLLTEGYIPYVASGGAGSSTVNSKVSDSWLQLLTYSSEDTLQLGVYDPSVSLVRPTTQIRLMKGVDMSTYHDMLIKADEIVVGMSATGGGSTARLQFINDAGSPRIGFNNAYEFPATDGTAGQVLTTDGSGDLSWTAIDFEDVTDANGNITFAQGGKIIFPDNTSVPDSPTNEQVDYMTFGANGSISQVSGRGALMITSSDDSLILANGDVGRSFTNSNITVGGETIYMLSDGAIEMYSDLQDGWDGSPTPWYRLRYIGNVLTTYDGTNTYTYWNSNDDADFNSLKIGGTTVIDSSRNISLTDGVEFRAGTGNDMRLYHNATNSYIDNYTGALLIRNFANDQDIILATDDDTGGNAAYIVCDGSIGDVKLYYADAGSSLVKFQTKANGVAATGNIEAIVENNGVIRAFYTGNNIAQLQANSSGGVLGLFEGGTNNVLLRSYGDSFFVNNVAIGKTSATEKLDVSGNAAISGNLKLDGVIYHDTDTSGSISSGVWYRIIEISGGSGRGKCDFTIDSGGGSGTPFTLKATVNTNWANSGSTLVCHFNSYGSAVRDLRVVRNATSNKSFVDVRFSGGEDNVVVRIQPTVNAAADTVDFTNVTTLPTGDSVETTLDVNGKVFSTTSSQTSDSLVITYDNKLGVGRTSPAYKLDVAGDIRSSQRLWLSSVDAISISGNDLRVGYSNDNLLFRTNSGERMRINSSGKVLINATTTSFSDSLYINDFAYSTGGWRVGTSATYVGQIRNNAGKLSIESDTNRDIQFTDANGGVVMYIDTSAETVGIGTSTTLGKFRVNVENDKSRIVISRGGTNLSTSTSIGALEYYADYEGSPIQYATIEAYSNGLSGVRGSIDFNVKSTSGNILTGMTLYGTNDGVRLGVGTKTPYSALTVAGQISTTGGSSNDVLTQYVTIKDITETDDYVLRFQDSTGSQTGYIGKISTFAGFTYQNSNGHKFNNPTTVNSSLTVGGDTTLQNNVIIDTQTGSNALYVTRSGNTNQSLKIYTDDATCYLETIQDENTSVYGSMQVALDAGGDDNSFSIRDGVNGTALFVVTNNGNNGYFNSGNFGIGNTSPSYTLDVSGNLRATSTILAGGSITASSTSYIEMKVDQTDSAAAKIGVSSGSTEAFFMSDTTGTNHITSVKPIIKFLGNDGTIREYGRLEVDNSNFIAYDLTGARTSPLHAFTITAENGNNPYTGFGGSLTFKNRIYNGGASPGGIRESARIRTSINTASATNGGTDLIFETNATGDGVLNPVMYILQDQTVAIGQSTTSGGDYTTTKPKLHVRGADTPGSYHTVARFQAGNDSDNTGAAILINHSNDRGLVIKAGRKDSDRGVAYFDILSSGGTATNMLTMGKYLNDHFVGIKTATPEADLDVNGVIVSRGGAYDAGTDSNGNVGLVIQENHYIYTEDSGTYLRKLIGKVSDIIEIGQSGTSLIDGVSFFSGTACNYRWHNNGSVAMLLNSTGLQIGNTNTTYALDVTGTIRASGDVIAYSDARVKENVKTIDNALDKVTQLRGVSYNKIGETEEKIGVIAQEIEMVLPQVVQEDNEGMKSVAYGNIVGVLIEAIKEQQKQIDELKARLDGSTK